MLVHNAKTMGQRIRRPQIAGMLPLALASQLLSATSAKHVSSLTVRQSGLFF